jgi:hypothetical protein
MKKRHTQKKSDVMNEIVKMKQKDSLTRETIINHLINKYNYAYNTAVLYYSDAMKDYNQFIKENMISDLEIEIDRFENLLEKATLDNDKKLMKEILIEINKLRGNYIIKTENKNTDTIIIKWGGEDEGTEDTDN